MPNTSQHAFTRFFKDESDVANTTFNFVSSQQDIGTPNTSQHVESDVGRNNIQLCIRCRSSQCTYLRIYVISGAV